MEQLQAIIDKIVAVLKDFFKALNTFLENKSIDVESKWFE